MALSSTITPQSIETVSRLFTIGSRTGWQLNLGNDYVAWVNDEAQGSWDTIVLLSLAHDEGASLIGGHELTEFVGRYADALSFCNLLTGEKI